MSELMWALVVLLVTGAYVWTWGTLMAYFQSIEVPDDYWSDLVVSAFFAIIPFAWIMAPFVTGFYQHGWTLSRKKKK